MLVVVFALGFLFGIAPAEVFTVLGVVAAAWAAIFLTGGPFGSSTNWWLR